MTDVHDISHVIESHHPIVDTMTYDDLQCAHCGINIGLYLSINPNPWDRESWRDIYVTNLGFYVCETCA